MADFEVYVDDDRYSVPSFYLISAGNEARARAMNGSTNFPER